VGEGWGEGFLSASPDDATPHPVAARSDLSHKGRGDALSRVSSTPRLYGSVTTISEYWIVRS